MNSAKTVRKAWWRWTASWAPWEWCWMFVLFVFLVARFLLLLFSFACLVILLSLFHPQIKQKWMKWMRYSGESIKKQHHSYINMKFARIFRAFRVCRVFGLLAAFLLDELNIDIVESDGSGDLRNELVRALWSLWNFILLFN